ncbi:MAG: cache domain-containing protein, partial [Chloroflexota bacterium]
MENSTPNNQTGGGFDFSFLTSIRARLIFAFLLVSLVPIVVIAFTALNNTRLSLINEIDSKLTAIAATESSAIGNILESQIDAMQLLASSTTLRSAVQLSNRTYPTSLEDIEAELEQAEALWTDVTNGDAEEPSTFSTIYEGTIANVVLNEFRDTVSGHSEIIVTDRYGAVVASNIRTDDYIQSDEEWWLRTYDSGIGQIYISDALVLDSTTGTDGIRIAVPIFDGIDGTTVIGVVRTHYELNLIKDGLSRTEIDEAGIQFLANADGQILASGAEIPAGFALPTNYSTIEFSGENSEFELIVSADDVNYVVEAVRVATAGSFSEIDDLGWFAVVTQAESEALAPVNTGRQALALATVIVGVIGLSIGSVIALRTTQPLSVLSEAAERIGRDREWDTRVDVGGNNEYGRLGSAFNTMAGELNTVFSDLEQRIAARTADLETAAEIASAANQIRQQSELISLTVNLIRDRFDFYYVQAYLLDEAEEFAVLSDGTGYA